MISFRLYLSAQTPQNGKSGKPITKPSAASTPTQVGICAAGTPNCCRKIGRKALRWPNACDSTTPASVNTASNTRQSFSAPRLGAAPDDAAAPDATGVAASSEVAGAT